MPARRIGNGARGDLTVQQTRALMNAIRVGVKGATSLSKYVRKRRRSGSKKGPKKKRKKEKKKPKVEVSSKKKRLSKPKSVAKKFGSDGCSLQTTMHTSWFTTHATPVRAAGYVVDGEFDSICISNNGADPQNIAAAALLHGPPGVTGQACLWPTDSQMQYTILNLGLRYPGTVESEVLSTDTAAPFINDPLQTTLQEHQEIFSARTAWRKWQNTGTTININWNGKPPKGKFRVIYGCSQKVRMMRSPGQSTIPDTPGLIEWDDSHSIDEIVSTETVRLSPYERLIKEYGSVDDLGEGQKCPSVGYFPSVNTPVSLNSGTAPTSDYTLTPGTKSFCWDSISRDRAWKSISSCTKKGSLTIQLNNKVGWVDCKSTTAQSSLPIIIFAYSNPTIYPNTQKVVKLGTRPSAMEEEEPDLGAEEPLNVKDLNEWRAEHGTLALTVNPGDIVRSIDGQLLSFLPTQTKTFANTERDVNDTFSFDYMQNHGWFDPYDGPDPADTPAVEVEFKDKHQPAMVHDTAGSNIDVITTQYSDQIPIKQMATIDVCTTFKFKGRRGLRVPVHSISEGPTQRGYLPYANLVSSFQD